MKFEIIRQQIEKKIGKISFVVNSQLLSEIKKWRKKGGIQGAPGQGAAGAGSTLNFNSE